MRLSRGMGVVRVLPGVRGTGAARAVVRIGGAGHSAAIHSQDPETITRYGVRVPVLRVAVNASNSTGSSGLDTNLALSMTLGTGFAGRSSIGENLEPRHLVNWTRVAFNSDPGVPFTAFTGIGPWHRPAARVPAYPRASNLPPETTGEPAAGAGGPGATRPVLGQTGVSPPRGGAADPGSAGGGLAGGALSDSVRDQPPAMSNRKLSQVMGGLPLARRRPLIFLKPL